MSEDRNSPPGAPARDPDLAELHLGRKLWLARLALAWERAWPALWPAFGIGGAFLALALFDILPGLPTWLHGLILVAFGAAFGIALWRGLRGFSFPGRKPARRRIERVSGLAHRPLTLARDEIAGGRDDPQAMALWQIYRRRVLVRIKALRVGVPAPGLARLDPLALRGALLVVLVIGFTISWGDGLNRIARALAPGVGGAGGPAVVDVWITPPAYTGLAPIFLSAGKDSPVGPMVQAAAGPGPAIGAAPARGPVALPEGATVLAQLSGGWGTPKLTLGETEVEFKPVADGTWKATATIGLMADADELAVRQGAGRVAAWPVRLVPDRPPELRFAEVPDTSTRGAVRVLLEGEDDYGFAEAKLYIRRPRLDGELGTGAAEEEALEAFNAAHTLDLSLPGTKRVSETSYHDLTAHPWAGLEVMLQAVARDGAGQPAVTESIPVTLPERYFRHPVARALVLLRKRLMFDPASREDVTDSLINLSTIPGSFNHDTVVFLALESMARRLRNEPGLGVLSEVQGVLWETALRLEDGQLSLAERRLRDIQKRLMEAMNRQDNAEIQKLMQELEKAMAEFLKEMMEAMKDMPQMGQMPNDPNARMLSTEDLQRMLDRARELAMTGNLDAAREMLSMLRDLLENLKNQQFAQGQGQQGDQKAWEMLRELQEMMKRQQELMDETHRQDQEGMRGGEPNTQDGARRQGELQENLQDMLRRFGEMLGEVPKSLGDAELAMREALEALRKGKPGQAVPPQGRALEEMQKGAGDMLQQMMRQFGQGNGPGQGRGGRQMGRLPQGFDPLGRPVPNAGNSASDDVEIPDESDTQRAREILEELRRRAAELGRPAVEMEYLERLLRRF